MNLTDLYQQIILDHNKRPRNFGRLEAHNRSAEGFNPLCGDEITLELQVEDDCIVDVAFRGAGCAISTASASLMTETLKGTTTAEAKALFARMKALLKGEAAIETVPDKLGALAGVRDYPVRVKCATLAWHTLRAALADEAVADDASPAVTTE